MMPALFAREANDADAQFQIHGVRRSLITLSRVGSFRAGRHGDSMRKLLTFLIALASIAFTTAAPVSAQMMFFQPSYLQPGPPPSYTGPGDISSGAYAWYGLRGYSAAYASPGTNCAIDIKDQAGANPLTCIAILSNGNLDVATIAAWVTAHSVTTIKVSKLYDQSGNSFHMAQATLSVMPVLTLNADGTLPLLTFSTSVLAAGGYNIVAPYTTSFVNTYTGGGTGLFYFEDNVGEQVRYNGNTTLTLNNMLSSTIGSNSFNAVQGLFTGGSGSLDVNGSASTGSTGALG
jgi:hypothetical protein